MEAVKEGAGCSAGTLVLTLVGRGITGVRIARHGAQIVAEEQVDPGMKGTSGCWFRPAGANSGCCQAEVYIVKRVSQRECVCGYTLETRLCGLGIWTI